MVSQADRELINNFVIELRPYLEQIEAGVQEFAQPNRDGVVVGQAVQALMMVRGAGQILMVDGLVSISSWLVESFEKIQNNPTIAPAESTRRLTGLYSAMDDYLIGLDRGDDVDGIVLRAKTIFEAIPTFAGPLPGTGKLRQRTDLDALFGEDEHSAATKRISIDTDDTEQLIAASSASSTDQTAEMPEARPTVPLQAADHITQPISEQVTRRTREAPARIVPIPPQPTEELPRVDPELREIFEEEALEIIATFGDGIRELARNPSDKAAIHNLNRAAHTLKGAANMTGFPLIAQIGAAIELLFDEQLERDKPVGRDVLELVAVSWKMLRSMVPNLNNLSSFTSPSNSIVQRANVLREQLAQAYADAETIAMDERHYGTRPASTVAIERTDEIVVEEPATPVQLADLPEVDAMLVELAPTVPLRREPTEAPVEEQPVDAVVTPEPELVEHEQAAEIASNDAAPTDELLDPITVEVALPVEADVEIAAASAIDKLSLTPFWSEPDALEEAHEAEVAEVIEAVTDTDIEVSDKPQSEPFWTPGTEDLMRSAVGTDMLIADIQGLDDLDAEIAEAEASAASEDFFTGVNGDASEEFEDAALDDASWLEEPTRPQTDLLNFESTPQTEPFWDRLENIQPGQLEAVDLEVDELITMDPFFEPVNPDTSFLHHSAQTPDSDAGAESPVDAMVDKSVNTPLADYSEGAVGDVLADTSTPTTEQDVVVEAGHADAAELTAVAEAEPQAVEETTDASGYTYTYAFDFDEADEEVSAPADEIAGEDQPVGTALDDDLADAMAVAGDDIAEVVETRTSPIDIVLSAFDSDVAEAMASAAVEPGTYIPDFASTATKQVAVIEDSAGATPEVDEAFWSKIEDIIPSYHFDISGEDAISRLEAMFTGTDELEAFAAIPADEVERFEVDVATDTEITAEEDLRPDTLEAGEAEDALDADTAEDVVIEAAGVEPDDAYETDSIVEHSGADDAGEVDSQDIVIELANAVADIAPLHEEAAADIIVETVEASTDTDAVSVEEIADHTGEDLPFVEASDDVVDFSDIVAEEAFDIEVPEQFALETTDEFVAETLAEADSAEDLIFDEPETIESDDDHDADDTGVDELEAVESLDQVHADSVIEASITTPATDEVVEEVFDPLVESSDSSLAELDEVVASLDSEDALDNLVWFKQPEEADEESVPAAHAVESVEPLSPGTGSLVERGTGSPRRSTTDSLGFGPLDLDRFLTTEGSIALSSALLDMAFTAPAEGSGFSDVLASESISVFDENSDRALEIEMFETFALEAEDHIATLNRAAMQLDRDPSATEPIIDIKRALHTIKGAAAAADFMDVSDLAHRLEDSLATHERLNLLGERTFAGELFTAMEDVEARLSRRKDELFGVSEEDQGGGTLRIDVGRVDDLLNTVGELVVNRSSFEERLERLATTLEDLSTAAARLQRSSYLLEREANAEDAIGRLLRGELHGRKIGMTINAVQSDWDMLEMDRYTEFDRLIRQLAEVGADVTTAVGEINALHGDFDTISTRQRRLTTALQDELMSVRMVPISSLAPRLYRVVRRAASRRGKEVSLIIEGGETPFDKILLDTLSESLLHLLRNSVDHGIEDADVRRRLGKPEHGSIRIRAFRDGSEAVIEIIDDGAGIDHEALIKHAREKGIAVPERMTREEALLLIFEPGFTTRDEIDDISGRGLGLEIVEQTISRYKGRVAVDSVIGRGTVFSLRLPVMLSVIQAFLVTAGEGEFAIPVANIDYVVDRIDQPLTQIGNSVVIETANQIIPVVDVSAKIGRSRTSVIEKTSGWIMVTELGGKRWALVVDELHGQQEIVVKPMGRFLRATPGLMGATILGHGDVSLIVDVPSLLGVDSLVTRLNAVSAVETKKQPDRPQIANGSPSEDRPAHIVMIVDDSLSVRRVVSRTIERHGWVALLARDGVEALELLEQGRVDLMLTDIEMPRMDGFDLISAVRGRSAYQSLPIVVLTSRSGNKHRDRALALGANEYLVKPFQEQELVEVVAKMSRTSSKV